MNDLQVKILDILRCFVDICDNLHIPYYLVCGTALGAAKYKGFIPWDDDVDVGLLRSDYARFLEEAPQYLPEHYFLQNYHTDPFFPQPFSKLRDSNTTFIEKNKVHLPINHGVYIDIFPIDAYPPTAREQQKLELKKRWLSWQWGCALNGKRSFVSSIHCTFFRIIGCQKRTSNILERYERIISAWPTEAASIWCNHGNWQGKLEYAPREQYGDGIIAKFEGLDVRIPERYDEYLTQKYGDWRADLPEDQKFGHHFAEVIDLERPYTDYVEHLKNGKIRIKCPQ